MQLSEVVQLGSGFKYNYQNNNLWWTTKRSSFKLSFLISKMPPLKQKEIDSNSATFKVHVISKHWNT